MKVGDLVRVVYDGTLGLVVRVEDGGHVRGFISTLASLSSGISWR